MARENWTKRSKRWTKKKYIYDFQQYETRRFIGDSVYACKANIVEPENHQSNLLMIQN